MIGRIVKSHSKGYLRTTLSSWNVSHSAHSSFGIQRLPWCDLRSGGSLLIRSDWLKRRESLHSRPLLDSKKPVGKKRLIITWAFRISRIIRLRTVFSGRWPSHLRISRQRMWRISPGVLYLCIFLIIVFTSVYRSFAPDSKSAAWKIGLKAVNSKQVYKH